MSTRTTIYPEETNHKSCIVTMYMCIIRPGCFAVLVGELSNPIEP